MDPMTHYKVTSSADTGLIIQDGDSVTVLSGVSIIDPSVNDQNRKGLAIFAGIQDNDGGNNTVNDGGIVEGFIGAWFIDGSNNVKVQANALIYGFNSGVEFHDNGHNLLTVNKGGEVKSFCYGVWIGDTPERDYTDLPNSGNDTIDNNGTIYAHKFEAIRMVLGGNTIDNTWIIKSIDKEAIHIDSGLTDPANTIINSGNIIGGTSGVAIVGGDAPLNIDNTGNIIGSIEFGAGNDTYSGDGHVYGIISGGAGNDVLTGGPRAETFEGGPGADVMRGGGGADTFIYNEVSDSTKGGSMDTIIGFDFDKDHIEINGTDLTSFSLITNLAHLQAHEAAVIETPGGGWFLVVDENGVAGYQDGQDYMMALKDPQHLPT
jgi:Ca2+-binding RTX toxin-like protein